MINIMWWLYLAGKDKAGKSGERNESGICLSQDSDFFDPWLKALIGPKGQIERKDSQE